jgi:hypothetical protein
MPRKQLSFHSLSLDGQELRLISSGTLQLDALNVWIIRVCIGSGSIRFEGNGEAKIEGLTLSPESQ